MPDLIVKLRKAKIRGIRISYLVVSKMLEYAGLLTDILVGAGESGKIDQTRELSIGLATRGRDKDGTGHWGLRLPRVVRESNQIPTKHLHLTLDFEPRCCHCCQTRILDWIHRFWIYLCSCVCVCACVRMCAGKVGRTQVMSVLFIILITHNTRATQFPIAWANFNLVRPTL
jgi:hypothetical protein